MGLDNIINTLKKIIHSSDVCQKITVHSRHCSRTIYKRMRDLSIPEIPYYALSHATIIISA